MTHKIIDKLIGLAIVVLWLVAFIAFAHSATVRLGDCAVFPPAPVHVIHRPHHFAHHRAPVCHCGEELGGPAGGGASLGGFSSNYGGNGDGSGYSDGGFGDAGYGGAGGGYSFVVASASGLLFVNDDRLLSYAGGGFVGKNGGSPGGPDSPPATVVPEPSTLALVVLGAGALLLKWGLA